MTFGTLRDCSMDFSQTYISHNYKELTIPADDTGEAAPKLVLCFFLSYLCSLLLCCALSVRICCPLVHATQLGTTRGGSETTRVASKHQAPDLCIRRQIQDGRRLSAHLAAPHVYDDCPAKPGVWCVMCYANRQNVWSVFSLIGVCLSVCMSRSLHMCAWCFVFALLTLKRLMAR